MVTAELKDKILSEFIDALPDMSGSFDVKEVAKDFEISPGLLNSILNQFERKGLAQFERCLGGEVLVTLNVESHDFMQQGGFKFEEEILEKNLLKLDAELKALKGSITDSTFNRITGIVNTIISGIGTGAGFF